MINIIMNILFPSGGGEVSKIGPTTQEQTTSNEGDFEQVLSILMAQMGLCVTTPLQNLENSVSNSEEGMDIQTEGSPTVILDVKNESLLSNTQIVDSSNIRQNTSSSIPTTELLSESFPVSNIDTVVNETEAKRWMSSEIVEEQEILNIISDEVMQEEPSLQLRPDSIDKQLPLIRQVKIFSPDEGKLDLVYEGNLSNSENGTKLQTFTGVIRAVGSQNDDLTSIQDKLHIKSVQLSTALSSEGSEEVSPIKPGQIFQDKGSQKNSMDLQINGSQKFMELLSDTKQDLSKNVEMGTKGNVLVRVLKTEWVPFSGEQNSRNAEQKSDFQNTNPQLGIPSVKSIKSVNEEASTKAISVSTTEPKDVIATLSSLRSIVSEQIKFAVRSETKTITIKLEPESLGALEVKVQEHSGKIGIQLTTSNNDVHKVLSQSLPQLRETLKQEGILIKDVQIISSGATSLMLNQDFHSHTFSREMQGEPVYYTVMEDSQQIIAETKPINSYHDGTLNLWV